MFKLWIIFELIPWISEVQILSLFQDDQSLRSKLLLYFIIKAYCHLYVYSSIIHLDSFIASINKSYNNLHEFSEML